MLTDKRHKSQIPKAVYQRKKEHLRKVLLFYLRSVKNFWHVVRVVNLFFNPYQNVYKNTYTYCIWIYNINKIHQAIQNILNTFWILLMGLKQFSLQSFLCQLQEA